MSQGSVGWWVIGLYLRAVGGVLTLAVLLSLVLMQLSQNFTFLWLTFWLKNRTKNSTTLAEDNHETTSIMDHGFNAVDNVIHTIINATMSLIGNKNVTDNIKPKFVSLDDQPVSATVYNDNFYLEMYFALAGLNLVFTIMRAFLFAYGGVKAAAKIHKILLKVIISVSYKFSSSIIA